MADAIVIEAERMAELFDHQTFLRSVDLVSAMISDHVVRRGMERHRAGFPDAEVAAYVHELGQFYRQQYEDLLRRETMQSP